MAVEQDQRWHEQLDEKQSSFKQAYSQHVYDTRCNKRTFLQNAVWRSHNLPGVCLWIILLDHVIVTCVLHAPHCIHSPINCRCCAIRPCCMHVCQSAPRVHVGFKYLHRVQKAGGVPAAHSPYCIMRHRHCMAAALPGHFCTLQAGSKPSGLECSMLGMHRQVALSSLRTTAGSTRELQTGQQHHQADASIQRCTAEWPTSAQGQRQVV